MTNRDVTFSNFVGCSTNYVNYTSYINIEIPSQPWHKYTKYIYVSFPQFKIVFETYQFWWKSMWIWDMSYIIFQSEQFFYFDSIATTPLHVKVCHKYYGEIRSTYFSTEYVISWLLLKGTKTMINYCKKILRLLRLKNQRVRSNQEANKNGFELLLSFDTFLYTTFN